MDLYMCHSHQLILAFDSHLNPKFRMNGTMHWTNGFYQTALASELQEKFQWIQILSWCELALIYIRQDRFKMLLSRLFVHFVGTTARANQSVWATLC